MLKKIWFEVMVCEYVAEKLCSTLDVKLLRLNNTRRGVLAKIKHISRTEG